MKKLIFTIILASGLAFAFQDSKYKLSEAELNKAITESQEVSFSQWAGNTASYSASAMLLAPNSQTRGGYLLRAFFGGGIALHRYYMGTNNKWMWAMYFCIPVVGDVTACVDFWGAVFDPDFYKKYANNDKYIVCLD